MNPIDLDGIRLYGNSMKVQQKLKELEEAARQLGFQVRWEKGSFRGGPCVVDGEAFIVLNKLHPPDLHFTILADSLRDCPLDSVFLAPAVRSAVEEVWKRSPRETEKLGVTDTREG